MIAADDILRTTPKGLYCPPGDFYIDPVAPVGRAAITHGHADHARAGHGATLATAETTAIMAARYGEAFARSWQITHYDELIQIGDVRVRFIPAGHVLGSAQIVVEHAGMRLIVSGDYKRRRDPTCAAFQPMACDVFITEATFALPVFRHPDDTREIDKLLASVQRFPGRAHLVGAYALGKAQRVIRLLREAGYDETIYLHGAMQKICDLYEDHGVSLGPLAGATILDRSRSRRDFAGRIVVGPPSAFADKWARRFADPVTAFASGWMGVRQRARQRGVELPLILSDHADWDELTSTIEEIAPGEVWITHGREDALMRWAELRGIKARPLSLAGYEDEND